MNLILHIFRKDARHLYPEIAIALVFTTSFAWVAPVQWQTGQFGIFSGGTAAALAPLLRVFLPVIWLVLITRLVQDDSLVGDRQFWVTRPYTWPTLLAAKVLFLLVFLYLPLALMQVYLLHHAGLDVRAALPDLLFYHLRLTAIGFLPVFAIATVTATFARQFVTLLAGLAYVGVLAAVESQLVGLRVDAPGAEIVLLCVGIVVLAGVVFLQYARRRTRISRLVLAALPLLALLVDAGFHARGLIERAYPATAANGSKVGFDPNPVRQEPARSGRPLMNNDRVLLSLPVSLRGFPAGTRLKAKGVAVEMTAKDGFRWSSPYVNSGIDLREGYPNSTMTAVDVTMPLDVFNRIRSTPVTLSVSLAVERTEPGAVQTVAAREPGFATPGRGLCTVQTEGNLETCLYPLRMPPPIDVSAQVSNRPCTYPEGAAYAVAQTFVGSDQTFVAYDFDPVAVSRLSFQLPLARSGPSNQSGPYVSEGVMREGYLCPGAQVTMTPHMLVGRERYSFTQPGVALGLYVRNVGPGFHQNVQIIQNNPVPAPPANGKPGTKP